MKAHLQQRQEWIKGRRQKRKLARHARLRRQILRYTMLLLLVVAGISGFTCVRWSINDVDRDIEIHGNKVVSDLQIRDALRGALGRPLYKLDPAALQKKVCALADVKYAFVRRYLLPRPHLRVEVLEEFPWATFCSAPDGPAEAVVSQDGRFIPLSEFPTAVQPPLHVCGKSPLKLTPADIAQWDGWVKLVTAQTGQPVDLVDLRNPAAIEVHSGPIDLRLGAADSTLTRRLGRLASVMPVAANLNDKLRYIDLSLESNIPLKVDKGASSEHGGSLVPEANAAAALPVQL